MNDDFKKAYKSLSLKEKQNQINNELLFISELIKNVENEYNISSILDIKKYDLEDNQDENIVLELLYEDIYKIERELITLFTIITKQ